jgi:hypothetical protein
MAVKMHIYSAATFFSKDDLSASFFDPFVSLPQLLRSSQTMKNVAAEINLPQLFLFKVPTTFFFHQFYYFNGKIQSPYTSTGSAHRNCRKWRQS